MRLPSLAIAGLFLAGSVAMAAPPAGRHGGAPSSVQAPGLDAEHLHGPDPVDLEQLHGRVVVLDFWATWCRPCLQVMPVLERLHQQHHGAGLTVLGISNEAAPSIRRFLEGRQVSYTVGRDLGTTLRRYRVSGLPTVVVIGRDGKIRASHSGVDSRQLSELSRLVAELLAEPAPG